MSLGRSASAQEAPIRISAEPWPEADELFRNDARWLGGDDAYSIDLGRGRVLWLFGDSFIAAGKKRARRQVAMVSNTIAVQTGYDPSSAGIRFYWKGRRGKPRAFFPDDKDVRYWPGGGARVGNDVLVFLMEVEGNGKGSGFEMKRSTAVLLRENAEHWRTHWLSVPANPWQIVLGSAGVLWVGNHVYAFSVQEPEAGHDAYLVRWRMTDAIEGDLSSPEWWSAADTSWVLQSDLSAKPRPLFGPAQPAFTVHHEQRFERYLQIQTQGFGAGSIGFRSAQYLNGDWSPLELFCRPEEPDRKGVLVYSGKAHPELAGADLVLTYVVDRARFKNRVRSKDAYYPRFLKCSFEDASSRR